MILAALILTATVAAGGPLALTVEDAAENARSRALHAQALGIRADEEEAKGGLGVRLPDWQLRIGGLSGRRVLSPLAGQGALGPPLQGSDVGVRVYTPTLQAFSTEQVIARHSAERRRALGALAERDVEHLARQLHTRARALDAQRVVVARRLALEEQRLELRQRQVAAGVLTRGSVDAQRLKVLRRKSQLRELEAGQATTLAELAALTGADPAALELVAPDVGLCQTGADKAASVAEAPEVRAWQAQAAEATAASTGGWLRLLPWPAFFQVQYEVGATRAEDDIALQLGFTLPVGELGAGEARANRLRARWMDMEARAAAQRIAADRDRARAQASAAADLVAALEVEGATVDDIRARLQDPAARGAIEPDAAIDLELALLDHEEAGVLAQAQCETAAWEQIRLGVSLDRGAAIPTRPGR